MNRDLYDIDELFRSALSANEETPSAAVRKSLIANLDKKDAESYKKRFLGWKTAAIILLLLLAGFILYESRLIYQPPAEQITKKMPGEKKAINSNKEQNKHRKETKGPIQLTSQKNSPPTPDVNSVKTNPILTDEIKESIPGETIAKEKSAFPAAIIILRGTNRGAFTNDPGLLFKENPHLDPSLKNIAPGTKSQMRIYHFKPYWMLTGLASYDRVNYKLDSDQPNAINSIQHREVHEPSFSAGILATRQIRERWGLQSGLIFSSTAIGISPQKLYALQDPSGDIAYKYTSSAGYTYIKPAFGAPPVFGDSIIATEAKHILQSLSVPVMIKYSIGRNKFQFIPGAGMEVNFITSSKLEIEIEDAANQETVFINRLHGTKSFYWSLVADADLRYTLNRKFSLGLRPMFRYAITPITENNVVETFPYSLGLSLGVTYKF